MFAASKGEVFAAIRRAPRPSPRFGGEGPAASAGPLDSYLPPWSSMSPGDPGIRAERPPNPGPSDMPRHQPSTVTDLTCTEGPVFVYRMSQPIDSFTGLVALGRWLSADDSSPERTRWALAAVMALMDAGADVGWRGDLRRQRRHLPDHRRRTLLDRNPRCLRPSRPANHRRLGTAQLTPRAMTAADLIGFVLARLHEEQRTADRFHEFTCPRSPWCRCLAPRRILDHVGMKLRIVHDCAQQLSSPDTPEWPITTRRAWQTTAAFALPYELHAHWREHWRP